MQHAIGIAATQVTGLREMFGSDTKYFHVGRAAQNGLMAALLAAGGFSSSLQALEAKRGWINVVSVSNSINEQIASLGKVWEISKNAFKPFPCGIVVHPVIDGCIQLHREMTVRRISASDIDTVHAKVHPLVLELTGKRTPKDGLQAKFSVYHGGSVGLVLGKAGPAQYEDSVVLSKEVVTVRDKINAVADTSLGADEALITVTLTDGTTMEKHVEHAVGSVEVPMSDGQLQEKFIDQVSLVVGREKAEKANKACWALETVTDVAEIARNNVDQ